MSPLWSILVTILVAVAAVALLLLPSIVATIATTALMRALRSHPWQWRVRLVFAVAAAIWCILASVEAGSLVKAFHSRGGPSFSAPFFDLLVAGPRFVLMLLPAFPMTVALALTAHQSERERAVYLIGLVILASLCGVAYPIHSAVVERGESQSEEEERQRIIAESSSPEEQLQQQRSGLADGWIANGTQPTFEDDRLVALEFPRDSQADLSLIRNAPTLKSLYLIRCRVVEEQLEFLRSLSELEELYLMECGLTVHATSQLPRLPSLRKLVLDFNPELSDASLRPLHRMTSLRELRLHETSVTPQGVTALQIVNPDLQVFGLIGTVDGRSHTWSKQSWREAKAILGETAFQQALGEAGLDGIPADAPEESPDKEPAIDDAAIENPADPNVTP